MMALGIPTSSVWAVVKGILSSYVKYFPNSLWKRGRKVLIWCFLLSRWLFPCLLYLMPLVPLRRKNNPYSYDTIYMFTEILSYYSSFMSVGLKLFWYVDKSYESLYIFSLKCIHILYFYMILSIYGPYGKYEYH